MLQKPDRDEHGRKQHTWAKDATDPRWVNLAEISMEEILTDHAFCEQKAATQCISLIQKYPEKTELVSALAPLVTEEWGHFRMVWAEMRKRGLALGKQRKDEYAHLLHELEPKEMVNLDKLLHKLMTCALIEARSCERFRLLAEGLADEYMRAFYYKFMVSEAGHYRLFIDLACVYYPEEKVRRTWDQWLEMERKVLDVLTIRGDRIH